MNANPLIPRSATRAFISMQTAAILSVIALGGGLLAYEWYSAHPPKEHHISLGSHKHHKKHEPKSTAQK
jgi:hypothetical protein